MEPKERPILFEKYLLRLLGAGNYSAHGQSILDVSMRSGLRTRGNWLVPGLAIVAAALGLFAFRFSSQGLGDGFGTVFGRIFIFDYMIFVLSWVSGWNMSYRWRKNSDLIEEVALTDMRPRHLFFAQAGGVLAVWFYFLIVFAVFEFITIAFVYSVGNQMQAPVRDLFGVLSSICVSVIVALLFLPPIVMLAWSHFESVALAHRMFALGALPRIPLGPLAATNFVSIALHVVFLSVLGCMVTGVIYLPLVILKNLARNVLSMLNNSMLEELTWSYAAMVGLLSVILAKRKLARMYQDGFDGKWIAFQWWGAAELDHPAAYPQNFIRAARVWAMYHLAQEAEETPSLTKAEQNAALMKYVTARKSLESANEQRKATNTPMLGAPAPMLVQKGTYEPAPVIMPTPSQPQPPADAIPPPSE